MNQVTTLLARRFLWSRHREGFVSFTAVFAFLGIGLGVATLIIVLSVMDGFRAELMNKILSFQGHIVVHPSGQKGPWDYKPLQAELRSIDAIQSVTPVIERQSILFKKGIAQGVLVYGMSQEDLTIRLPQLDHDVAKLFDLEEGIILGHKLAQKLYAQIGDHVTLASPDGDATAFGTLPRMRSFKVIGVFDAGMHTYDSGVAFIPLAQAQNFFNLPQTVTGLEINLHHPERASQVADLIKRHVPATFHLVDWQRSNSTYMAALQVERNVMFLILSLIILIASFNILTSMTFLVKDKSRDIAFLRAMGASRPMIYRAFYRISMVIGFCGVVSGLSLGIFITLNLETLRGWLQSLTGTELFSPELYYLSQLPAILSLNNIVDVCLYTMIIVAFSGLYPAWKAASLNYLKILRNG